MKVFANDMTRLPIIESITIMISRRFIELLYHPFSIVKKDFQGLDNNLESFSFLSKSINALIQSREFFIG